MREYVKKQRFLSDFKPSDGMIVIDVNCQGVLIRNHQEKFKEMFPATIKEYIKACLSDKISPGTVMYFKEKNFEIALLVTQDAVVGPSKDVESQITLYTKQAVQNLVDTSFESKLLCSLVNSKFHKIFISAVDSIGKGLDWYIYGC